MRFIWTKRIERYIVDIVFATRFPQEHGLANLANMISFGASPRASISLALAARAYAFIKRRGYVIPEDIRVRMPRRDASPYRFELRSGSQ